MVNKHSLSGSQTNLPQVMQADQSETSQALEPGVTSHLAELLRLKRIRPIDYSFAEFVYSQETDLQQNDALCMALLAAYISVRTGEQHTCISLEEMGQPWPHVYVFPPPENIVDIVSRSDTCTLIASDAKANAPEHSNLGRPLILQSKRVYLQRYWQYEVNLAVKLQQLAKSSVDLNNQLAKSLLTTLFDNTGTNPPNSATLGESSLNWQKIAVAIAISQKLCLITGGPGTGKTTTVTKLLALLQGLAAAKQQVLNIQLVAPTGKAAARLTESISAAKQKLPAQLQENLPTQCQTIHRLLGAKPLSPYFKANEKHPLHLDVLVIDEASMVDLPLMSKLFQALPDSAQVIVLGDQQQLASVETGSVLADICQARWAWGGPADHVFSPHKPMAQFSQTLIRQLATLMPELTEYLANEQQQVTNISLIANNVVSLVKSHRFDEHSGIGQLAKAIQAGHHSDVERLLKQPEIDDIGWKKITENPSQLSYQKTSDKVVSDLVSQLTPILKLYCQAVKQKDIQLAFHCLSQQQVLCAQRTGYWGVKHVNQLIEQQLEKLGLVNLTADFYIGRPVMLSKNEHQLNLFNGDMGIVMADPQQSELTKVWFLTPEGDVRGVLPSRLPSLDTVYAMTIHKSQGSEFENVHLCLPPLSDDNKGRGLSKELLYTGLTRAKKRFVLYSQSRALRLCLAQQCIRTSGLTARLVKSRC